MERSPTPDVARPDLARHVLRTWALDAVAFAVVLAGQDPSWRTETFPACGGHAVLSGRGLYVNRVLGAGLDGPVTAADIDLVETRSAAVGVPAAFETTRFTDPSLVTELTERGYVVDDVDTAVRRSLDTDGSAPAPLPAWLAIERADGDLLPEWQHTARLGWGHESPEAVRASDAFARAAAVVDGPNFVIARDRVDRRPVGCASLTIRDGVATLGAMSTVPSERGRGVQSALIEHRVEVARRSGCDVATSMAVPGGASLRNLMRHGFAPWFDLETRTRPAR